MEELIPITLFLCIAAVAILRPVSTRLGRLLEAMARERSTSSTEAAELARVRVLVEHVARRIDLMEERLDFTERLLTANRRPAPASRFDALRAPELERVGP